MIRGACLTSGGAIAPHLGTFGASKVHPFKPESTGMGSKPPSQQLDATMGLQQGCTVLNVGFALAGC